MTPWTAAGQASLSFTISQSLLKLKSIESVMPSHILLFPSPPAFNLYQHQLYSGWESKKEWIYIYVWASLPFTISRSLLKLKSIESVMPSNHLTVCCPLLPRPQSFPASGSFLMSWLFTSGGQSIGASASASVLPMNIQGLFPLGLTGLISL